MQQPQSEPADIGTHPGTNLGCHRAKMTGVQVNEVPRGLRIAAAYSWRIIVIGALLYVLLQIVARLEFVAIALFVGLVITALIGPVVNFLHRFIPKGLAVAAGLLLTFLLVSAIFTFIGAEVVSQFPTLSAQFKDGLIQIEEWLQDGPLHIDADTLAAYLAQLRDWISTNQTDLAGKAIGGASTFVEAMTGFFLALFASIFFMAGGDKIWDWILTLTGRKLRHRVDGAGHVAWTTFAGYTRGIMIVAGTNAVLVAIALTILRVPLSVPLALLVFFGSFIPIIGAPLAMIIAAIVALAANGPLAALLVIVLIALIGQFEGHILQPLVMARAVSIHPLAVALSVTAGTVLAGIIGAVVAVPVVSVVYAVGRFWVQTAPRIGRGDDEDDLIDPTGITGVEPEPNPSS